MNWILGVLIILILLFLVSNYNKKRRKKNLLNDLVSNWSKPKDFSTSRFNLIEKYYKNTEHKHENEIFHRISDRTVSDLDLEDVFEVIDRTNSKIGEQYLYYKIRNIGDQNSLSDFHKLTLLFEENESLRLKTQVELTNINYHKSYYFEELVTSEPMEKPKILWLVYTLTITTLLCMYFGFYFPILFLLIVPIFAINTVLHYKNKWKISSYINAVSQLPYVLSVLRNIAAYPEIKSKFPDTSFIKEIEKVELKTKFISFETNTNNEFIALINGLIVPIKILFNLEYLIFYSFIDSITIKKRELKKMFHFIGEIDAAISTASLKASSYELCNPVFIEENNFKTKSISHPLIEDCITNDLSLENNSLLLTGSNMSGKTTFIRSVAINSILAQTLNICFAEEYMAPFFKLYSSIRITDDLLDNTSYYLAEVLTIKELIDTSKQDNPCLFVLDEIFKGTNTVERVSGGKAILSYLNQGNNMVLVSTHDIELTEILSKENYKLYHFTEQIDSNELIFDYKLKNGELKTRNAIRILELHKYPTEIIMDARTTEEAVFASSVHTTLG